MNINDTEWPGSCMEISKFVDSAMDSYSEGLAESTKESTQNIAKAFGRLISILATKGGLTAPEVIFIAKGWVDSDATFSED